MSQTPFYNRPIPVKRFAVRVIKSLAVSSVLLLLPQIWNARPLRPEKEYGIAPPPLPSPNAFDIYRQSDEAFSAEERAARTRGDKPVAAILDWNARSAVEDPKKYPLSAKVKWLALNRRGFGLFDEARKAEHRFPLATAVEADGEIEAPSHLRFVARHVGVECQVRALQKQPEKAVARALDTWQMGLNSERGAPLVPALQTFAIEAIARHALDAELAHLNGAQAARLAKRLETMLEARVAYRDILQAERDASLLHMKRRIEVAIRDQKRLKEMEQQIERGETNFPSDGEPAPELKGPLVNWKTRRLCDRYARGKAALLENADAPWPAPSATLPTDLDEKMVKLMGVLAKSRFYHTRADVMGQITLARLALHAFRKDKGIYPQTLDELVPNYLKQAPRDAFANGTLHYRRKGLRYELWSFGPDARDDDARPAQNATARTPRSRFLVEADSGGDIVANISR